MNNKQTKPKLLIHIGYHKTGTTFWQKKIFSASDVNLIDRLSIRNNLLALSPYDFKSDHFNKWLESQLSHNKLNVISEEELSGNIHTSGNGRSITYETIERLSEIEVADVYILVFIRNQINIIDSCYRQYVKRGGCYSFNNYIHSSNKGAKRHRFPGFSLEHFKYDDVIKHCYKRFAKESVFIYPYETFLSSQQAIVDDLSNRLGTKLIINTGRIEKSVNKSLSNFSVSISRLTNRLFSQDPISRNSIFGMDILRPVLHRFYLFLDSLLPHQLVVKSYVSAEMKAKLEKYYSLSNKATQELTKLDLRQLNYPTIDATD